jgi:hypothetical protein
MAISHHHKGATMNELHRQHIQEIHFRNAHPGAVEFTATGSVYGGRLQIEAGDKVLATPLADMQRLPENGSQAGAWWVLVNPGVRYTWLSPADFAAIGGAVAS